MTNGDRIRQMSNEELAEWLDITIDASCCNVCVCGKGQECYNVCTEGIKAYLDTEVEK